MSKAENDTKNDFSFSGASQAEDFYCKLDVCAAQTTVHAVQIY